MKKGTIVCAFPATGKSTVIQHAEQLAIKACDSDSEDHHWVDRTLPREERVEREDWVEDYVKHLQAQTVSNDFVFASTHDVVRNALVDAGVHFVVVYPTDTQRAEYLTRVADRTTGLHGQFGVDLLTKMWDTWLTQMNEQPHCGRVVLQDGQYLSDVLDVIKVQP